MGKRNRASWAGAGRVHAVWLVAGLNLFVAGLIVGFRLHDHQALGRSAFPARCVNVVDGDTLDVVWMYGTNRVRVAGVDAPETRGTRKLREQADALGLREESMQRIGQNATRMAKQLLLDREVVLVFPRGEVERDTFGRLLTYIEVNGEDFGAFLLANGLAETRPEPHPRQRAYQQLQREAARQGRGLFAWQPGGN
ncbi:MAG: thermonuclease family protein [Candidatus Marinimicrobia bacterium]|nr:thermonuclease family protein [Candidatus Neomarinimicrobiota bacterium]